MIDVVDILYKLAPHVHLVAFGLLVIAGFNLPISEDLVLLTSGSIAGSIIPENTPYIFLGCLIGAFISDIMVYGFGLFAGNYLLRAKWFKKLVSFEKIKRMKRHFGSAGTKTLFFGRMIPLGLRNMIFFTAGVSRMHIVRFAVSDFLSLSITSTILFTLGYGFGKNVNTLLPVLDTYKFAFAGLLLVIVAIILVRRKIRKNISQINSAG